MTSTMNSKQRFARHYNNGKKSRFSRKADKEKKARLIKKTLTWLFVRVWF